jgi:tetratricopeptide (TPR) repeat protein
MNRPLPRLLISLAVLACVAAGWIGWRHFAAQREWDQTRPTLPATAGNQAPGLDARLAACMQRLQTWPPDVAALRDFARTCHANGLFEPAISAYGTLMKLDPSEPRWPYLLASVISGYGRLEEAIPLLRQTTALQPNYIMAWLKLGDALLKSNATADADAAFHEVLRREPDNHYALLGLARCDLQASRLTAARSHLQQAVANHPDFASAQSLLATVFDSLGNPTAAALAKAQVQAGGHYVEPPDPWVDELVFECHDPYSILIAASAAAADGESQKAFKLIDRGLQLAPDDARLHRKLAKMLTTRGDLTNARMHMERAVALDPTDDSIRMDLLRVLHVIRDDAGIEKVVAEGLRASPGSAAIHFEAGLLAAQAGDWDEAVKHFEFTWQTSPDQIGAALQLADIHFRTNDDEGGFAVLEQSLARNPQETAALVKLIRRGIETGDRRTLDWLRRATSGRLASETIAELRGNYERRFGPIPP